MSFTADYKIKKSKQSHLIFDATLLPDADFNVFDMQWLKQHAEVTAIGSGRGEAWFVDYHEQHWVLRHYMRGGLVAHVNKQSYLGWHLNHTRAIREWRLLQWMLERNLPVPRPVAALVHWPHSRFAGIYHAHILIQRLMATKTMADCLNHSSLDDEVWRQIGYCVRRFHDHNVYHADLNANNILIDERDQIYLIDFDRGKLKQHGGWKQGNMERLKRSLLKLQSNGLITEYSEKNWSLLMQAYVSNTVP